MRRIHAGLSRLFKDVTDLVHDGWRTSQQAIEDGAADGVSPRARVADRENPVDARDRPCDDNRAARPPDHLADESVRISGRMAIRQQVEAGDVIESGEALRIRRDLIDGPEQNTRVVDDPAGERAIADPIRQDARPLRGG